MFKLQKKQPPKSLLTALLLIPEAKTLDPAKVPTPLTQSD